MDDKAREAMMDDVARVLSRHMRLPVAHVKSSSNIVEGDRVVVEMTFVGNRGRVWTALDRMREAADVGDK